MVAGVEAASGGQKLLIVDELSQRTASHTQLQVLAGTALVHQLFWHCDGEGKVATNLPDGNHSFNIADVNLYVSP